MDSAHWCHCCMADGFRLDLVRSKASEAVWGGNCYNGVVSIGIVDLEGGDNRLPRIGKDCAVPHLAREPHEYSNVHRHSGSSAVEISLKASEHQVVFTGRDFGRGMPAGLIQGPQTT